MQRGPGMPLAFDIRVIRGIQDGGFCLLWRIRLGIAALNASVFAKAASRILARASPLPVNGELVGHARGAHQHFDG